MAISIFTHGTIFFPKQTEISKNEHQNSLENEEKMSKLLLIIKQYEGCVEHKWTEKGEKTIKYYI